MIYHPPAVARAILFVDGREETSSGVSSRRDIAQNQFRTSRCTDSSFASLRTDVDLKMFQRFFGQKRESSKITRTCLITTYDAKWYSANESLRQEKLAINLARLQKQDRVARTWFRLPPRGKKSRKNRCRGWSNGNEESDDLYSSETRGFGRAVRGIMQDDTAAPTETSSPSYHSSY